MQKIKLKYMIFKILYIGKKKKKITFKSLWNSYQNNYEYAKNISFKNVINSVQQINNILEKEIIPAL